MPKQLAYDIDPAAIGLPSSFTDLGGIITAFLPAFVTLAGMATFAYLLFGGFRYLTAGGDEKAVGEAMKMITNAVIGLIIVFGAWWGIRILETILGIHITQ